MSLIGILRAFLAIGPDLSWKTLQYTRMKERQEKAVLSKTIQEELTLPGNLLDADPMPGGAHFRFARASLEIVFLTPDLARLSWEPGLAPLPYALAKTNWPVVETKLLPAAAGYSLSSKELTVNLADDGRISYVDATGRVLRAELPPGRQNESWIHQARLSSGEFITGLGERSAPLNRRGQMYRMWNAEALGSYPAGKDPLYLCIPAYLSLQERGSYLIFYENTFPADFDLRGAAGAPMPTSRIQFQGGMLRYYFISGPPDQALERYTELTGRPPLPPRWALGYHQSRWGYRSVSDIREVAAGFRQRDLPLSAIHLDIDYMRGYRVFTVDPKRFPDLSSLARELKESGIHLVTILDPGIKQDRQYPLYQRFVQDGLVCKRQDGQPQPGIVWPGWTVFPDFSDPRTRRTWGEQYASLVGQGVDGFWHDMNEPSAFVSRGDPSLPLSTQHCLEGRGGNPRQAHNVYGLLMNRAGYEGLKEIQPGRRPWIVSRSGWAGTQRYAWNWTGDTESSWDSLRMTLPTVLGLGLSGIPFTGPDIGGFSGKPDAELYLRWFQMTAFLPFFRTHSALGTARREPWVYGDETTAILRQFLKLRARLMPYYYTLAWQASQDGSPPVRPLFWPHADLPALFGVDDAFLLGDALLVAPIFEKGATCRSLLLPPGRWYSFWNDTYLDSPLENHELRKVDLEAHLDRIPLLVRDGSIIPMEEDGNLVLHLYPPRGESGCGQIYSDAGDGYGPWRLDRFTQRWENRRLTLLRESRGSSPELYPFPYSSLILQIHGWNAHSIRVDGKELPIEKNRIQVELFTKLALADSSTLA